MKKLIKLINVLYNFFKLVEEEEDDDDGECHSKIGKYLQSYVECPSRYL